MFKRLKSKSEFTRHVLTLMTGTTIAQAIPIAISPILTRIYTPEDFGLFALYMGIASVVSVIATGRYELAVMLPKKDEDAFNIVALSIIISFFVSFVTLLVVWVFNERITSLLGNSDISTWLYFIPISVLLTGLFQSLYYWNNRLKQYSKLANSRILQSFTTSSTNVSSGYIGFKSVGLIFGTIFGQMIATTFLLWITVTKTKFSITKVIKKKKMIVLARKNIKFPTWNLFASLLNAIRLNLIIIFLSRFFLSATLGYYYFADKLLRAPTNVLITAFSDVYYQRLSTINSYKDIYELSIKYTKKMFKILIVPYIILLLLLKESVPFVFGDKWTDLYLYLYILSVPIFFNIIIAHFSKILIVINRQEVSFKIHFYRIIGLVLVLLFLYFFEIFNIDAIVLLAINEIIWLFIGVIVIKNTLQITPKSILLYGMLFVCIALELLIYVLLI